MGSDIRMSRVAAMPKRAHPLWLAYIVHRLSGLILALFLPLHFWVLAMTVSNPDKLDGLLYMNTTAAKTLAESGLVLLLALHLFGGLRLMALEWLPWSAPQKTMAALAVAVSFLLAVLFFLQAV